VIEHRSCKLFAAFWGALPSASFLATIFGENGAGSLPPLEGERRTLKLNSPRTSEIWQLHWKWTDGTPPLISVVFAAPVRYFLRATLRQTYLQDHRSDLFLLTD
jgi:hypothetical protein